MNPILASLLAVFVVSVGMVAVHVILAIILAINVASSVGIGLSRDEVEQEIEKRWLGRIVKVTYPIAFWWLMLWDLFTEDVS